MFADFQLLRCILKILEAIYSQVKEVPAGTLTPRKRSSSRVVSNAHRADKSPGNNSRNSRDADTENIVSNAESETSRFEPDDGTESECQKDDEQAMDEFVKKMTLILYEVIQNLLADVIAVFDKVFCLTSFVIVKILFYKNTVNV